MTKNIDTSAEAALVMRECIQKIATGPEYSKDLNHDEAFAAMRAILSGNMDPVQIGVFFIALRMKRETDDENCGILHALKEASNSTVADIDEVVDMSDPYDGFVRSVPSSPFLPMVLAASGVNVVTHGVNAMGPKHGVTAHKVYKAMGLDVSMTTASATKQLEQLGWAYIDQEYYCKPLHDLVPVRQSIVKRQVLTTVENLIGPIRGRIKTHIMAGYVHKAYPPIYESLAKYSGFDSGLFIRGVEGGIVPSLQQAGRFFSYLDKDEQLKEHEVIPENLGVYAKRRAIDIPEGLPSSPYGAYATASVDSDALAQVCADYGRAALSGSKGMMYDSLVYSAALCLVHLQHYENTSDAAEAVREVLDSGEALVKLESAL